ncbi:MAG: DUF2891 domain-containing protein [Bacteroidia bacterium]|nr:DUF2891 domain-containing protein [Bacteroidia bacterium]
MRNSLIFLALIVLCGCNSSDSKKEEISSPVEIKKVEIPVLNLDEANRLALLPLHCMETEYPNKLNQTIGNADDLQTPKQLHPAFYGCFDWHSAVHGHWSLVSLLKQFPDLENRDLIIEKLKTNLSKENILAEVKYFDGKHNATYERTYGWAWVLKLAEELHNWDDPLGRELENNLQPLTDLLVLKYIDFLPKLNYPIRVGEHTNTAFGLTFAYDYAQTVGHTDLKQIIDSRARDFFLRDEQCPIDWEPSGFDFLSPCLEEAAIMKRILTRDEFIKWLEAFMPQLFDSNFQLETGKVSDRTDGKLVHLDGVNFSRAWSLNVIAEGISELEHLKQVANSHINYSLPGIVDDNYEGGHWLGSFAIYALNSIPND